MTIARNYQGQADQSAMIALARSLAGEHLHTTDLPYRLSSWALDDPANARLWQDESGQLLGWAVLNTPFWTVDFVCRPGLETEMLAWVDARVRETLGTDYGHECWFLNAFADQAERIRLLEAAGFASQADVGEDSWSKVWMRRPSSIPVKEYRLPAGFSIRPLNGEAEAEAYTELHRAVFESRNMTVEWRRRAIRRPEHEADLDIVVVAPDGRLAAFCIGWLDARGGQIEPLGCHKDFRQHALGRVALAEVLRRMQARGVGEIHVETDNYRNTAMRLYESMGFETIRKVLVFRKDYDA
jgi:ribosomal protein S18 acetylase RimI-like enzyme